MDTGDGKPIMESAFVEEIAYRVKSLCHYRTFMASRF